MIPQFLPTYVFISCQQIEETMRLASGFHNAKWRSSFPTLKSSSYRDLQSHLVYEINFNGWVSIYVGQTSGLVTTRISELREKGSQVCQHLGECSGSTNNIESKILEACRTVEKIITIEATYISKLKPGLNTRDKYRGRELTLKYWFKS